MKVLKNIKAPIFILLTVSIITFSCLETEPVSPIPAIKFVSFKLAYGSGIDQNDTVIVGKLEFEFIDGDADLGVYEEDSSFNLFLTPFEKIDSLYYKIDSGANYQQVNKFRIPHDPKMDRVGQNKTINGVIRFDITYIVTPEIDTLKYEFYISDRALNKSNVESTSDFSFKIGSVFPF